MTYIYAHFFSNGDKYVGISNNPEQRWNNGFDSNNTKQYNHKVLIANEKYDRVSLVISENLPRRIAEIMEAILINGFDDFNLNIKGEMMPNLHGNNIVCIYNENFSHVYPQIDGEVMYHSPEIESNNNYKLKEMEREKIKRERKRREKLEKERREIKQMERERKINEKLENERIRIRREEEEQEEKRRKEKEKLVDKRKEKKIRQNGGVYLSKIIKENKKEKVIKRHRWD